MLTLKDPSPLKSRNFIDREWVVGGAGTIDVTNPANGELVRTTADGDADIDAAVADCMSTKFRNCGQTCVCTNRIYVREGVAEESTAKLKVAIEALRVGDGFDETKWC
jgi:succinate-semialdehyde dehydrogenase/glutarate-semialdehyde dehydrogenase